MLRQLLIRNFALVEEISLTFAKGMNVLTGETGAGKSIIVDAINFLLGGKADKDIIRTGSAQAYVEGIYEVSSNHDALSFLCENELAADDGLVIISRELNQTARSTCRIAGMAVPLAMLRRLTSSLMDIHGQHEHQSLLDEKRHLGFLDDFGDEDHQTLVLQVRTDYESFSAAQKAHDLVAEQNRTSKERLEVLSAQERELQAAKLKAGDEDTLRERLERLRNASRIRRALSEACAALYDGGRDADAAMGLLRTAKDALGAISSYDPDYEKAAERIAALYYEAEDIGLELRAKREALDLDEDSLQAAAERLDLLKRLGRKYGTKTDDLLQTLSAIKQELAGYASLEERLVLLERQRDQALAAYRRSASLLSVSRKDLALRLQAQMEDQLNALNMAGTRFIISFDEQGEVPSPQGGEQAHMLLAPNRGEQAKPLSKIASGGETSRLMLALKCISAQHSGIPAMVFDEIDTGISGRTAQVVAEKLWDIARFRQVLCVTHLQQIAAMASSHYLVDKHEMENRTITSLRLLDNGERILEVSRMISGLAEDSRSSLAHAEYMLGQAADYRAKRPPC
ncbi:MAG: DNA repair protein RecN [Christensenellales bacterium]